MKLLKLKVLFFCLSFSSYSSTFPYKFIELSDGNVQSNNNYSTLMGNDDVHERVVFELSKAKTMLEKDVDYLSLFVQRIK